MKWPWVSRRAYERAVFQRDVYKELNCRHYYALARLGYGVCHCCGITVKDKDVIAGLMCDNCERERVAANFPCVTGPRV